ncbi:DNA adenine methylase [Klebsiella pneumoniae]|nr:DNA adenine methylase [Klebsiella pneumoniae]SVT29655.1 DNA adenine methylase [Klebsiella pneumoniae]
MSTILKWAGNKTAVMHELKKHLPAGPRLVEPFAGSCAVMMATEYPHYLVADINSDLINLYKQIAFNCEKFIANAKGFFASTNSETSYYNIRQDFNHSSETTDFWKAVFSFILIATVIVDCAVITGKVNLTFHTGIIKKHISRKTKSEHLQRKQNAPPSFVPATRKL